MVHDRIKSLHFLTFSFPKINRSTLFNIHQFKHIQSVWIRSVNLDSNFSEDHFVRF